jgi:hypothetical protein
VAIVSTALMSATIAALIVGGKAFGKVYAIRQSTEIVFFVGRVLTLLRNLPRIFVGRLER